MAPKTLGGDRMDPTGTHGITLTVRTISIIVMHFTMSCTEPDAGIVNFYQEKVTIRISQFRLNY